MTSGGEGASQFDVSEQEIDKLVSEVIRFTLFKTYQTSGCPIKREEISQIVTKSYRQRFLPAYVINRAKEKLSSVFGYEMRELQRSRASSTNPPQINQSNTSEQKSYVILSKLPTEVYKKYVDNGSTSHHTGFTFVVISLIHLAGGKIQEENLWRHLNRVGLCPNVDNSKHPVLGDPRQALENLVQRRYIQKDKVHSRDGSTLFYELAERSLDAPFLNNVNHFISQIVNKENTIPAATTVTTD